MKVKAVELNLGTAAAKVNAGLVSLAIMQHQQQGLALGLGNGEVVKGFHGSGRGGLVTPPSPRSLSADSNRSRQRRKKTSTSRGKSASQGAKMDSLYRGVETESLLSLLSDGLIPHPSPMTLAMPMPMVILFGRT
jgi:hypothetical protein